LTRTAKPAFFAAAIFPVFGRFLANPAKSFQRVPFGRKNIPFGKKNQIFLLTNRQKNAILYGQQLSRAGKQKIANKERIDPP
jgi:hypothetical protein